MAAPSGGPHAGLSTIAQAVRRDVIGGALVIYPAMMGYATTPRRIARAGPPRARPLVLDGLCWDRLSRLDQGIDGRWRHGGMVAAVAAWPSPWI